MDIEGIGKIYSICEMLGLPCRAQKIVCPLPDHAHHNNTPSFSIKLTRDGKEVFRCHGSCGAYGDVIDFVGYMRISGYNRRNRAHLSEATSYLVASGSPRIDPVPQSLPVGIDQSIMRGLVPPGLEAVEYARSRGVSDQVIRDFNLGQKDTALAIPSYSGGVLMGIKYRSTTGVGGRYWSERGSRRSLFNRDKVENTTSPVIFAKGEIAVMVLQSFGFLACCMTTGESDTIPEEYSRLLVWAKVLVIGDNDSADIKAKLHPINLEKARQLGGTLMYPPELYKDVDEWLIKDSYAKDELGRLLCI